MKLQLLAIASSAALIGVHAGHAGEPPAPRLRLPLIEAPVAADAGGDAFVVFYSGDGGWAKSDRGFTRGLNEAGMPVVGLDSLHYFLLAKDPDRAAADLARVIDHYARQWRRPKVILAGYSFGAGAVALIGQHLPPEQRSRVTLVALLGPRDPAELVLRPRSYFDVAGKGARPVGPALAVFSPAPVLCIYGERDRHAACDRLAADGLRIIKTPGNHHFDGQYEAVARDVASAAGQPPPLETAGVP